MNIAEFSVKRPVTSIMLMGIFTVIGVISFWFLQTELVPKLTFPNVLIITEYTGAGPLEVEKSLTKPMETAVRSVSGIKNVKASSSEGFSFINAEFNWGQNIDEAVNELRDRIGQIKNYLPTAAKEPIILRMDTSGIPVVVLGSLSDPKYNLDVNRVYKFCVDNIQPKLERTPGVASVMVMGGREREIHVNVDGKKLYAYGLSFSQIVAKIGIENLNISSGNLKDTGDTEFLVRSAGEFKNPEEVGKIIVGIKNGAPVYLRDVAAVEDTLEEEMSKARIDGNGGISIIVTKGSDANTVETAKYVRETLEKVKKEFPEGFRLITVFDTSEMISDSMNALKWSALEGALFAALIIFAFLGRVNPTLIICISIPISLLIAFTAMYFTKTTINIMTMGGLVIALGRLVDDSVVVMENIFRRRQLGENAVSAAIEGAKEVAIPVISSTVVTVIVFLPILFAQGFAVQLFKDFGATVFYALMGSLIVAFTIVPMLASKLFRKGVEKYDAEATSTYDKMKKFYGKTLSYALSHKTLILLASLGLLIVTAVMIASIGKEFVPSFVSGRYQLYIKLPKGSTLEASDKLIKRVEKRVIEEVGPDLLHLSSNMGSSSKLGARMAAMRGGSSGPNVGNMMISFKKHAKTTDKQLYNIIDRIGKENKGADIQLQVAGGSMFGSGRSVEIKIYGEDLALLKKIGTDLVEKIKGIEGIKGPSSSMDQGLPELTLEFKRDKLAQYGLSVAQVGNEVTAAVDGMTASIYREAGEESNIVVRMAEGQRRSFTDLQNIPVQSPLGFIVPLKDVADINYTEGPAQVDRENAKRLVTVSADISGRSLSAVTGDVRKVLAKIYLPQGYFFEFGGQYKDMMESFLTLAATLLMALLLIYMILASLYESFIHPLTIMISVPFSFTGAVIALFITGTALGVTAMIGFIMLVGIVATNAIVLIDFIIKKRETEKDRRKAVIEAAETRLRPILITAIATIVALLPIAIGWHEGMELEIPLGKAVVGGLFTSTFLTLYIVPIVYEIFDNLSKRKKGGVKA